MALPSLSLWLLIALMPGTEELALASSGRALGEGATTSPSTAAGEDPGPITVEVQIDRPRPGEQAQVASYLRDMIEGIGASELVAAAEGALRKLGRFRSVVCKVRERASGPGLRCGVVRARTIRQVRVEGLPLQMLESDLRRRIFLRAGESLDEAIDGYRGRLARQRERVEDYLERQGFVGARVVMLTPVVSRHADVDVIIRVEGGTFVQVREVRVADPLPLDRHDIRHRLLTLCGSLDAFVDTGMVNCYTKDRLRSAIERLEEELRDQGFPEGRIQVDVRPIDALRAADAKDRRCGASGREALSAREQGRALPARCVDVDLRVRAGPRLVSEIVVHDPASDDQAGERLRRHDPLSERLDAFFTSSGEGGLDLLSRTLQWGFDQPLRSANDSEVRRSELQGALTFREAGASDAIEAEHSRAALREVLARTGYFHSRIEVSRAEPGPERVEVRFDIWPGNPVAIRDVVFEGNRALSSESLLDAVELAARARNWRHDGFVTQAELQGDAARLQAYYESQGWHDATVTWRAYLVGTEQIDVHFLIDEGQTRYTIAGVRFHGGVDDVTPALLSTLAHCQWARDAGQLRRAQQSEAGAAPCAGNPLYPTEIDADAQRVRNAYVSAGYPYVDVDVSLSSEWTAQGPYLDVRVAPLGQDGARPMRVELGEIFIDGNNKTERALILQEMGLSPEERALLNPEAIARGVSRLRKTGVFSRVATDYVGIEERARRVHLLLHLEEKPTFTFDTSLGFSTDDLFVTRFELRDRNFAGRMLDLGTLVDIGLFVGRSSQAQLKARWPRILGSNFDATLQPGVVYTDEPSARVPRTPDDAGESEAIASWFAGDLRRRLFSLGILASLDWRAPAGPLSGLVATASYEFGLRYDNPNAARIPVFSEKAWTSVDGLLDSFEVEPLRFGILAPRISYSSVRNPFDPTSGWLGEASLRVGSSWLGSEESFALLSGRATAYVPLSRESVLSLHGRVWGGASDLGGPGTSVLLAPELLVLGGDRSVRGFNASALAGSNGPFGLLNLPAELSAGLVARDSLTLFGAQFNVEFRQLLVPDLFLGDLKWALFVDAGVVTDDLRVPWSEAWRLYQQWVSEPLAAGTPTQAGASLGAGLRYVLPVGPISFDVAYSPTHQQVGVHFQLGYAF